MKINVGICDDEKIACAELKMLISEIKSDWDITIYNKGIELLDNIEREDLVILDIGMPEIDGMKIAEYIRQKNNKVEIIFLTGHIELMSKAFEVRAFRFLCKPVDKNKLLEALDGVEKEIRDKKKLVVRGNDKLEIIDIKDIVYIEAYGDGTFVYMKNRVVDTKKTLKWWEEKLGQREFYKSHRTYIVSLGYVSSLEKTKVKFSCFNNEVPVARRHIVGLRDAILKFTKEGKARVV